MSYPHSCGKYGRGRSISREQWRTQSGFVLAAVGSAIGLGNIWRFSYLAYEHGGGAFLLPYLIALFTAGIPLLILEFAIGHERIGSAPLAYSKIRRRWEWLGWWAVVFVMFGIVLYYTAIVAWCLNYFVLSFSLGWGDDTDTYFFSQFLQVSSAPQDIGGVRTPILVGLAVVWLAGWMIVHRGVQRGIELANKILMPLLLLLTLVLIAWSISLDGAIDGLRAYVTPDFARLSDPTVWIDAYSQIFFTLSLAFGIMIAYASYLPNRSNITGHAVLTAVINSGYSLLAGCAVFSVLGFMAASQGQDISDVVTESIGLAFVVYPKAIGLMPGGSLFGAVFFLCLFVAGLSSVISIMEAFVAAMIDKFGFRRRPTVNVVCALGFLGSIIFTTRAGLIWLDIVDHFITHYALVVVGILECVVVGWLFSLPTLRRHVNRISSLPLPRAWEWLIRVFVPAALALILLGDLYRELSQPYGGYTWKSLLLIGWDWLLVTLLAAFIIAGRPWRTRHRDAGGRMDDIE